MQVGLKHDSSFLLLYCDETILRKYSPLIHSRFIMSPLKDHNHFVLSKSFQLHACLTSPRLARLRAPNGFLMKVKRAQLTGNENAV